MNAPVRPEGEQAPGPLRPATQAQGLRRLVTEVVPDNRFYTPRLEQFARRWRLAPTPDPEEDAVDDPEELLQDFFASVPFTTKQELVDDQEKHPPFGTNLTYPLFLYTRYSQTSGTTRAPLRWLDTPESWGWMVDNLSLIHI